MVIVAALMIVVPLALVVRNSKATTTPTPSVVASPNVVSPVSAATSDELTVNPSSPAVVALTVPLKVMSLALSVTSVPSTTLSL